MAVPPSKTARRYDVSRAIVLDLLDPTPQARLASVKLLFASLSAKFNIDFQASLDTGIVSFNEDMDDKVCTVDFQVVFPMATLDEPEPNTVNFVNWTVRAHRGGSITASIARDRAFAALTRAIDELIAPGQTLHGRIQRPGA